MIFFALTFLWLPLSTAINAPNADDFDILLAALIRFDDAASYGDKIATLFMRHGEHYVVFARIVAIAQAQIFGHIDFAALIVFGALAPIITALLLIKISDLPLCQGTLAACLMVLLPQYVESLAWASGGLQHLWVWPFVLAAFAAAQRGTLVLCLIFAAAACFTQGNGILVLPLCAICFAVRKRWLHTIFLSVITLAASFLHSGSASDAATLLSGDKPLVSYLRYALGMLGAPLATNYRNAVAIGSILCAFSLSLLCLRKSWRSPAICCSVLTVLLTAPINALARIRFGESYGFDQSRYTYPGLILIACVIILTLRHIENTQTRLRIGAISSILISGWWIYQARGYFEQFALRQEIMTQSLLRRLISDQGFEYPNQTRALDLIQTAETRGYYRPPEVGLSAYLSTVSQSNDDISNLAPKMVVRVEQNLLGQNYILISGYGYDRSHKQTASSARLILRNSTKALEVSTRMWNRPDVTREHVSAALKCGFLALIPKSLVDAQDWNVSLRLEYSDRTIERQILKLELSRLKQQADVS